MGSGKKDVSCSKEFTLATDTGGRKGESGGSSRIGAWSLRKKYFLLLNGLWAQSGKFMHTQAAVVPGCSTIF